MMMILINIRTIYEHIMEYLQMCKCLTFGFRQWTGQAIVVFVDVFFYQYQTDTHEYQIEPPLGSAQDSAKVDSED